MGKTLLTVRDDTLYRLGDTELKVWSNAEIDSYLQEGYDELAIRTLCFWDQSFLEDLPYIGNFNGSWEKIYFSSGEIIYEQFSHTESWESEYDSTGLDPGNHTSSFEDVYLSVNYISALSEIPDNLYKIERAIWDNKRLIPMTPMELEADPDYQTTEGDVAAYSMDQEGLRHFRKYRKPSVVSDIYSITGTWGILRDPSDITDETPVGTWGTIRRISGESVSSSNVWGLVRRVTKQTKNTRIEYFRRGNPVASELSEFELPDLYVKYVRHFAMWRSLEREGPGQDTVLGEHYHQRFEIGIAMMLKRKSAIASTRIGRMGGAQSVRTRPPGSPNSSPCRRPGS